MTKTLAYVPNYCHSWYTGMIASTFWNAGMEHIGLLVTINFPRRLNYKCAIVAYSDIKVFFVECDVELGRSFVNSKSWKYSDIHLYAIAFVAKFYLAFLLPWFSLVFLFFSFTSYRTTMIKTLNQLSGIRPAWRVGWGWNHGPSGYRWSA